MRYASCTRVASFEKNKQVGASYYRANSFYTPRLGIKYRGWQAPVSVIMDGMVYTQVRFLDGYHRVPNVNRNSDGDFDFNLGNFEKPWNDGYVLLTFCYSFVSTPSFGVVFLHSFLDIFLPTAEHAANFVQKRY